KNQRRFTSIDKLKQVIDEYIHYYNHDRIKSKLICTYTKRYEPIFILLAN
ncbi:IS3 family transposase, partial [Moraxella oculi]